MIRPLLVLALAVLTLSCRPESSDDRLLIRNPWAAATPPGATVAAVYMSIDLGQADAIVSASTPAARKVEMHTTTTQDGTMMMRPVGSVEITPGKPFVFEPGGTHFMLIDLKEPLQAGTSFPLTLKFRRRHELTVEVQVRPPGSSPHAH